MKRISKIYLGTMIVPLAFIGVVVSCSGTNDIKSLYKNVDHEKLFAENKSKLDTSINKFMQQKIEEIKVNDYYAKKDPVTNKLKMDNLNTYLFNDIWIQSKKVKDIKKAFMDIEKPLANFLYIIDKQSEDLLYAFKKKSNPLLSEIPDNLETGKKEKYTKDDIDAINNMTSLWNKVIKIRNDIYEKQAPKNVKIMPNNGSYVYVNYYQKYFEDNSPQDKKVGFFEQFGKQILKSEVAKKFWNKFLDDKIHN